MIILDAGHKYLLNTLDGNVENILIFVKREGENYPGNEGSYCGTTLQEVFRACIDRLKYVNKQVPSPANHTVIFLLRRAIWHLEKRAARRHGLILNVPSHEIENVPVRQNGHIV